MDNTGRLQQRIARATRRARALQRALEDVERILPLSFERAGEWLTLRAQDLADDIEMLPDVLESWRDN